MPLPTPPAEFALTLALAVVAASGAPLLLIAGDMTLLGASDCFFDTFGLTAAGSIGRLVFELDRGHWDAPRLRLLLDTALATDTPVEAYEFDLRSRQHGIRRLVCKAEKLVYAGSDDVRLLLSVADVTDARIAEKLKDDLVREKAVLLQEIQHRVANSLQIIASVLMQSARRVQSDEARRHLHDAHHRVMSIAAMEKQLAASAAAEVALRPYLTQLCASIGASMIADHDRLTLTAAVDDTTVPANVSISLGLIVTELVINALKHAFPDGRTGAIGVDFAASGANWTLGVGDDGVGMSGKPALAGGGLGTSIIAALAKQLRARIRVEDAAPGTRVTVVHTHLAAVNDARDDAAAGVAV